METTTDRKVTFGLLLPQGWRKDLPEHLSAHQQTQLIGRVAREAESLGFHSGWLFDHLFMTPEVSNKSFFECWTLLSALANQTRQLRLGTLVSCNSYRHPALLAKMAATLDAISNGRLELGIGAGWAGREYDAYGFDFPRASIRIGQLEEAILIIKSLWTQKNLNFKGRYYSLKNATCSPKPIQKPRPSILIGGGGELMLRLAARHSDRVNFRSISPKDYEQKLNTLKRYCLNIKRDYNQIQLTHNSWVVIGKKNQEVKEKAQRFSPGTGLIELRKTRIVGTPQECVNRIKQFVKLGVNYFMLYFPDSIALSSLRLFNEEVMPAF